MNGYEVEILSCVAAFYVAFGFGTYFMIWHHLDLDKGERDAHPAAVLAGTFWPVLTPWLVVWLVRLLARTYARGFSVAWRLLLGARKSPGPQFPRARTVK